MADKQRAPADQTVPETIEVDLRQPIAAAALAWVIPGAGHLYQRRYAKAILFFVCILGTYFFGLTMGGGRVVYASLERVDRRWQYFCQVGVGAAALPAVLQNRLVRSGQEPLWGGVMAPPRNVTPNAYDELAEWHDRYTSFYELGTLYTVVAGLLNVLAIYDAYSGPFMLEPEEESDKPPPGKKDEVV